MDGSFARSASGSYAGSVASSRSSTSRHIRADNGNQDGTGEDIFDRPSSLESGIFGVLYTLRKENNEVRVRIRWVILKILLDAWQLFTTVIAPATQGWSIKANGPAWTTISVLTFTWLSKLSYGWYLTLLYIMLGLLGLHVGLCVWVAWCFKEQKFPFVWPLKVLRIFSSLLFQAFDIAALNLIQLGISCRYTGYDDDTKMHFDLFPQYSCSRSPHLLHAIVCGLGLGLFIAIALLTNMAEVEVNLLSRRPFALGHSGPAVIAFALKVLLTLVRVFIGWSRVQACLYLGLSLAFAWQFLRWSPHLLNWVNYLRSGVSTIVVWCSAMLMLLVFHPGIKEARMDEWADAMTVLMLVGLAPAFATGALMSWAFIRYMAKTTLSELKNAKPGAPLTDICQSIDDPRDVEMVARCCRVWRDRYTVEPAAMETARQVIQAGVAMFPNSAYMILLQANFMIAVMGVSQSGSRRIEDARRLNPGIMSRFIMFVRQQNSQQAAGSSQASSGDARMDLLAYVEYQRKQRMVVRLHREALQAICGFWKLLDASKVSFMHLSKALSKIETSAIKAQTAYRVVLDCYGNNPKLVRLYGKFLLTIKNDPWRAAEYFTEADRLDEIQSGNAAGGGPLLPDGTPLGRMDEIATAVLVISSNGDVQVANRYAHVLFGYKRGTLEGKPMAILLAPQFSRWLSEHLAHLVKCSSLIVSASEDQHQGSDGAFDDTVVVGMHSDRLAFHVKLALRKASGVGDDSTFIAMMEIVPPVKGVASLWAAHNGTIVACDPHFVSAFGWRSQDVNGAMLTAIMAFQDSPTAAGTPQTRPEAAEAPALATAANTPSSPTEAINRLLKSPRSSYGLPSQILHKYDSSPVPCVTSIVDAGALESTVYEIKIQLNDKSSGYQMLVVNRKGTIVHGSKEILAHLSSLADGTGTQPTAGALLASSRKGLNPARSASAATAAAPGLTVLEQLAAYTLCDFMPAPWKEMHYKYLKGTTTVTPTSPNRWTCRNVGTEGPTLEMRTAGGKPLYMRLSVGTIDMVGETHHVIRMSGSSLNAALDERRLRLQVSQDGFISCVEETPAARLLGLNCKQLTGRALWEIIDWSPYIELGSLPAVGPLMFAAILKRELSDPGVSFRVHVSMPPRAVESSQALSELMALAWTSMRKPAVLQVHIELPSEADADAGVEPLIFVDLWLMSSVSGLLEVDSGGRVRAVLEELMRPAGLLFGVAPQSLVGSHLGELVAMPPGRSNAGDLLFPSAKKSSLKSTTVESGVKVGSVHVLQATHADGLPNTLDVQAIGKPGSNQNIHILLRSHTAPMLPGKASVLPPRPAATGPAATLMHTTAPNASAARLRSAAPDLMTDDVGGRAASRGIPSPGDGVAGLSTPPEQPLGRREVGNSSGTTVEDSTATAAAVVLLPAAPLALLPPPPDGLGALGSGLPVPAVAPAAVNKAALMHLVRKTLAADTSKAVEKHLDAGSRNASGSNNNNNTGSRQESTCLRQRKFAGNDDDLVQPEGGTTVAAVVHLQGGALRERSVLDGSLSPADIESVNGEDEEPNMISGSKARISKWIATQGDYYQNSALTDDVNKSDNGEEVMPKDIDKTPGPLELKAPACRVEDNDLPVKRIPYDAKGDADECLQRASGGFRDSQPEDDNASEGGQSAISAQSGDGDANYKRGKRYRRLMRLISGQTQEGQQRYWLHALATVALLASVHVICFALTIHAVRTKRDSMVQLGRSGQAQRHMHQIMADVRSLDMISRNKTHPRLYTAGDAAFYINRISVVANEMQMRFREILDSHHTSAVRNLLFYTTLKVWDGNEVDDTDKFTNITIWDFSTRFYAMAKDIEQYGMSWVQNKIWIADNTTAGQFLIKSGPDLWKASRRVLDALLNVAVADARWVDNLQIVFLCVEGAAITFIAACYMALLLKAVAIHRYKLYSTFMLIPLGLTKALASQSINLAVDEEDDDDDSNDGDEKASLADEQESGDELTVKQKRRAMLAVSDKARDAKGYSSQMSLRHETLLTGPKSGVMDGMGGLHSRRSRSLNARNGVQQLPDCTEADTGSRDKPPHAGPLGRVAWRLRRIFARRGSQVSPLPHASSEGALQARRKLMYDSHETRVLLMPLVIWSAMVVAMYSIAVVKMRGIVEVIAVHSVVNFMGARIYRAVFYCQELAAVDDPVLLAASRAEAAVVWKQVRDAWYTLQLGSDAYRAIGPDTERFPMVQGGLAHSSAKLEHMFYSNGQCHRLPESGPCPGPENRFYQIIRASLDTIMQQFMVHVRAMASSKSNMPPGLGDEHLDFIYNIGTKDLIDGNDKIQAAHLDNIMSLFNNLFVLQVILFILFWVIFAVFLVLLLNPLLKRSSRERRRVADLLSQLPLELDVERLVARALGMAVGDSTSPGGAGAGGWRLGGAVGASQHGGGEAVNNGFFGNIDHEGVTKWKSVIRTVMNSQLAKAQSGSLHSKRGP